MKIRLTILLAALLLLLTACASVGPDAAGDNSQLPGTQAPNGTFSAPDSTITPTEPPTPTTPCQPLPFYLNQAMREAYSELYGEYAGEYYNGTADEVFVDVYFGCFGENHVAFISYYWFMYDQALWTETLMGLEFRYSDGQSLDVYRDGQLLSLSKAVENGWFTQEELAQLHAIYQAQYPYLYEEEWE